MSWTPPEELAAAVQDPEFLGAVCHELRGPLGAIGTWVHVLASAKADPEAQGQALAALERAVRAEAQLVTSLSDLAAALAGKLRLTLAPVDLVPLLAGVVEGLQPEAHELGVALDFQAPSQAPIVADAERLRLALAGSIGEVLRRTLRRGQITIRVRSDATGSSVAIERAERDLRPVTVVPRAAGLRVVCAQAVVALHGGKLTFAEAASSGKAPLTIELPPPPVPV